MPNVNQADNQSSGRIGSSVKEAHKPAIHKEGPTGKAVLKIEGAEFEAKPVTGKVTALRAAQPTPVAKPVSAPSVAVVPEASPAAPEASPGGSVSVPAPTVEAPQAQVIKQEPKSYVEQPLKNKTTQLVKGVSNTELGLIGVSGLLVTVLVTVLWRIGRLSKEIAHQRGSVEQLFNKPSGPDLSVQMNEQYSAIVNELKSLKAVESSIQKLQSETKTTQAEIKNFQAQLVVTQRAFETLTPVVKHNAGEIKALKNSSTSSTNSASRLQASMNHLFMEVSHIQVQSNVNRAEVKTLRREFNEFVGAKDKEPVKPQENNLVEASKPDTVIEPKRDKKEPKPVEPPRRSWKAPAEHEPRPIHNKPAPSPIQEPESSEYTGVRELAQAGLSAPQIAAQLGIERAVVDMVMALASYRESNPV